MCEATVKMQGPEITITGFVIPGDWDKHGNVHIISIVTDSCEKYIVADEVRVQELLGHVDARIKAEGIIAGEDLVGNKIVQVRRYEVLL